MKSEKETRIKHTSTNNISKHKKTTMEKHLKHNSTKTRDYNKQNKQEIEYQT